MKTCTFGCLAILSISAAVAEEPLLAVDLLGGHSILHEAAAKAGAVMGISIARGRAATDLEALCDELRVAADLVVEVDQDLPLRVVFIVPYKAMAIEGYYLPVDGTPGLERLVPGRAVHRPILHSIVARAGIPPGILDETEVEHEISCELDRPSWLIRWEDVRSLDGEAPAVVIERAQARFLAIHRAIVEHAAHLPKLAKM